VLSVWVIEAKEVDVCSRHV